MSRVDIEAVETLVRICRSELADWDEPIPALSRLLLKQIEDLVVDCKDFKLLYEDARDRLERRLRAER